MALDTFIFDMDDVLCEYNLQARLQVLQDISGVPAQEIYKRIWGSGFEDRADRGAFSDSATYLDAFAEQLQYPISKEEWVKARAMSMTPFDDVLDAAARLSRTHKIAVLTNNTPLLEETLAGIFPRALDVFGSNIYFSCNMGLGKPDPEIFRQTAEKCESLPENCLFTDDKLENVEGAKQAGMPAIHFTSPSVFLQQLRALGDGHG